MYHRARCPDGFKVNLQKAVCLSLNIDAEVFGTSVVFGFGVTFR